MKAILNEQPATETQCRHIIPTLAYYATRLPQNTDNHTVRITNTPRRQNLPPATQNSAVPISDLKSNLKLPAQRRT